MIRSIVTVFLGCLLTAASASADPSVLHNDKPFVNPSGTASSFSTLGDVDLTQGFFLPLGTNDRTCQTCHLPSDGWSFSAATAQKLFNDTDGFAALFQFDGQNVDGGDLSTLELRREASSLMLSKGLTRFNLELPAGAEFEIVASEGTYGNPVDATHLVVYRRPLATTNFGQLTTSLWDGRGNTIPGATTPFQILGAIFVGGTILHGEGSAPSPADADTAAELMLSLSTAQRVANHAGKLDLQGALGGAENHSGDPLTGPPGFDIFDAWATTPSPARQQIARGQEIFNDRVFPNGGRCSGCHSVANQGNNANGILFNIGIAAASRRTEDIPLYTLRNLSTGETVQSSDPGLAITTGSWSDVGRFKVPTLRGLAARAPYFHNGFAEDLEAVVDFYDERFSIGLTASEKADLVAFLRAL